MLKILAAVALVWLVLMPPLFTGGACTRAFDDELAKLAAERKSMSTLPAAREYWRSRGVPYEVMPLDVCRRARDRSIGPCGPGPLVYAAVPVSNLICRVYRDDSVKVQLHFDQKERLARVQADMSPYKFLPLPWLGTTIDWAR